MSAGHFQPTGPTSLWRIRLGLASRNLRENWALFIGTRIGIVGLVIIGVYALLAAAHPILMNTVWEPQVYDPVVGYAFDEARQPAPPSLSHPLGTDPLGRDILSQLIFSARSEFLLGLLAATVTVTIGTRRHHDHDAGDKRAGRPQRADRCGAPGIGSDNRHPLRFRGHRRGTQIAGSLRGGEALHRSGQGRGWRAFPHHFCARRAESPPSIVPIHDVHRDSAIFSEAVLSFLGLLDVRMSWGLMIHTTESAGYLLQVGGYWWLIFPASLSITLLCSSFYLVGRSLDEVVNPRLRSR